jgi:hypothetical protein
MAIALVSTAAVDSENKDEKSVKGAKSESKKTEKRGLFDLGYGYESHGWEAPVVHHDYHHEYHHEPLTITKHVAVPVTVEKHVSVTTSKRDFDKASNHFCVSRSPSHTKCQSTIQSTLKRRLMCQCHTQ